MAMSTEKNGVELVCGTDVEPRSIRWVWNNWLAAGKVHILAGSPGTGKTTIALSLGATLTTGGLWPDGTLSEPGNILIWSGEDDPQDTLSPRLLAHGADRKRFYFVSDVFEHNKARAFDPAQDMPKLYEKAAKIGEVKLIIVDPIVSVVAFDSHKNAEVRRALQSLVALGEQLKAVILGISHFSKGTMGHDPLERVTGSIAFSALPRVVLVTAKVTDPQGNAQRVLARAKSNHGPDGGGYYYGIEQIELPQYPDVFSSQVVWGKAIEGNARAILSQSYDEDTCEHSMLSEAVHFLEILLADGPVSKQEVDTQARAAGFTNITLRRAKTALGIEAVHDGYGKGSIWKWALPSKVLIPNKDAHPNGVRPFEKQEHLLSDLKQCHPPIIEGCSLSDILTHAIPEDYEDLKDPKVLAVFALSLKDAGKIKDCLAHEEKVMRSIYGEPVNQVQARSSAIQGLKSFIVERDRFRR